MKHRSFILDIFRLLAISGVVVFHFLWSDMKPVPSLTFAQYGYLGVEMFFILSGFLVYDSLVKAKSITQFYLGKFIRLFPSLLIWSLIIWIIANIFDTDLICKESHSFKNLLASISFVSPAITNSVFGTNLQWLYGNFWYISVIATFYIIAGATYFFDTAHFIRNYTILSSTLFFIYYATVRICANYFSTNRLGLTLDPVIISNISKFCSPLLFFRFSYFLLFGVLFRFLSDDRPIRDKIIFGFIVVVQFLMGRWWWPKTEMFILSGMLLIWLVYSLFFAGRSRDIQSPQIIAMISDSTYPLYIMHEAIGIILISYLWSQQVKISHILLVTLFLAFIALIYSVFIEKRLTRWFKQVNK